MYTVLLEAAAERNLRRLDAVVLQRVVAALRGLADNPRPAGCRKLTGSDRDWRVRVGDYRVVYEIDDRNREVRVMRIRHRREAYR
ncbi:MAG: type II toxin-antitoxin system RelE/ParE family toxin [candidate division WOR-3 bacterium]|nr:type II toxin-antitoxin system RelE/ParE family toxin [candidate division WOR-3 bacterium]